MFRDGEVITYNTEIACRRKCDLGFTGAVVAQPLADMVNKLTDDDIDISVADDETQLLVRCKNKETGIRFQKDILLPVESVERPGKFSKLHEDFCEAVTVVGECVATNEEQYGFALTCVHVHPEFVEACDNVQVTRFRVASGIARASLVKKQHIKAVSELEMTKISETETWLHFKNASGLVLSVRRFSEEYRDLTPVYKLKNPVKTTLPGGLVEALERAEIFSAENADNNHVIVSLKPGWIQIRGEGSLGWYREKKQAKYTGPVMKFSIPPKVLAALVKRTTECEVAADRLRVDNGRFVYICSLIPESKDD